MTHGPVFKLLSEADWAFAEQAGVSATALDQTDGFVHLSSASQVQETARRYYSGAGRVRLLRFDSESLGDIRWEPSRGGERFPHLYGPLAVRLATGSWWLHPETDGTFRLPEDM